MVEIEKPFEARTVQGVIKDPAGEPLPETHFEIRDASGKVRSAKTDKTGRFRIPRVAEGSYSFKATRDGFQSMVGKVVVSTQSIHKAYIELTMRLGV